MSLKEYWRRHFLTCRVVGHSKYLFATSYRAYRTLCHLVCSYFQFGTIGFVIGHEYTHGFDNNGEIIIVNIICYFYYLLLFVSGRRTNEVGNVENWWTDASVNQFVTRSQCFIDQYGRYALPDALGSTNGGAVSFFIITGHINSVCTLASSCQ